MSQPSTSPPSLTPAPTPTLFPSSNSPQSVGFWEGMTVFAGAILLILVGLAGLGVKALNNAFDPKRAEAIVNSMVAYQMPGGAKGLFGANLGGAKIAVAASQAIALAPAEIVPPPQVELFVAQIPIVKSPTDPEASFDDEFTFSSFSFSFQDAAVFQVATTRTENRLFCGASVPVTIQAGTLTVDPQAAPIAAVKYEATVTLDTVDQIAIVSALGEQADQQADRVFQSLQCQLGEHRSPN